MRKKVLYLMIATLSVIMVPNTMVASEKTTSTSNANTTEASAEVRVMLERLNEIKEMDKSSLTRAERKELRKEVRTIKKAVRGSGLYISTGAIIIILLLIIIL